MRVLLSEGSGLTSRQVAGRLHEMGHHVGVVSSETIALTRCTKAVRWWHRVPAFGSDPLAWLAATLAVYEEHGYELLFPTQEQVAVLAAFPDRLGGVVTAVPPFAAVGAVLDKVAARATLARLGLRQPESALVHDADELRAWGRFPAYVKAPIGTATSGVCRIEAAHEITAFGAGLLVQEPVEGPLAMVQSVFDHGRLVAFHANLRLEEGVRGGASRKRSIRLAEGHAMIEHLGRALAWNGGLSADVILTAHGPSVIDVNPRLVEPGNAWASGVDLVGAMLDVATGRAGPVQAEGRPDVDTQQRVLAVLGAAERVRRRDVLRAAARRAGHEELTPLRHDWRAIAPLALAVAVTLVRPAGWRWFASGTVASYALSPDGWCAIQRAVERAGHHVDAFSIVATRECAHGTVGSAAYDRSRA